MIDSLKSGRALTVCFERNCDNDSEDARIRFSGYDISWPDGTPVNVGLNLFCQFGVRTLFGRKAILKNLLTMYLLPIEGLESPLPKVPRGIRSRRFYLQRTGDVGRVTLLDGTPTQLTFGLGDDERVVRWVGLREIPEGGEQWYDIVILPKNHPLPLAEVSAGESRAD